MEKVTLTPQVVDFKNVVLGQHYIRHVVIANPYDSAIWISHVRASNSIFSFRGLKLPLRIRPDASIALEVALVPPVKGNFETYFVLTTNRGSQLRLHAFGNRTWGGVISRPGKINFGSVRAGWGQRLPVTLANSGKAVQTITGVSLTNNEFAITGLRLPAVLDPGESVTFAATFVPHDPGAENGHILVDVKGTILTIPLTGNGLPSVHLGLSPTQLDFGTVTAGTTATLSGKLLAGRSPVTVYSAGVTSAEFALSGLSFPLHIPAGGNLPFSVAFSPAASGIASAVLSFRSTAGSLEEKMNGNVVSKTSHRVNLLWKSVNSGVVGYNIYRANTLAGPYSKLNAVPDSQTSYLDSTIESGHTYYYATTALAANGKQSKFSNQVSVSVP